VQQLDDITLFIIPYLEKLGIRSHLLWRVKRWLKASRNPDRN
jgi:hypothetical protein